MNPDHQQNLEEVIDSLCENLVWAWNYYHILEGLHEEASVSRAQVDRFPSLMSCLWSAFFDALFIKLNHFIDRTKNVHSFYYLFKLIRRYLPDNKDLLSKIEVHESKFHKAADPIIEKIENWRNQAVAHLTRASRDDRFYEENKMHLNEIKIFLQLSDMILETYSLAILNRINDTISGSLAQKKEIKSLFEGLRAEQPHSQGRS